jgi:hypothetical protein
MLFRKGSYSTTSQLTIAGIARMSPCVRVTNGRAMSIPCAVLVVVMLVNRCSGGSLPRALGESGSEGSDSDDPNQPGVDITYNLTVSSQTVSVLDVI